MATGRAEARHLIDCSRNCLRGDEANALLRSVEATARRLEERSRKDADGLLPPGWLADLPADDGWAADTPSGRAERRHALLAALDRTAEALAPADGDGDGEPEAASARLAAAEFGLEGLDEAVLLLALRCAAGSLLGGFAGACGGPRPVPRHAPVRLRQGDSPARHGGAGDGVRQP